MSLESGKRKGFTLIELLVVIAIIAILSAVVLASLRSARNKADAVKIASEMRELRTAFELYMTDKGVYPNEDMPDSKCMSVEGFPECSDNPVAYLTNQLVANKYISSILNPSTDGRMYYLTGSGPSPEFLYESGGDGGEKHSTCGGKILTKYILSFYSDKPLSLSHPGTYYPSINLYRDFDPYYDGESVDNWYCIGV
jgi:prepilin-type N-terminal cleavage/methylation domain-containing protein